MFYSLIRPLFFSLDAEDAHNLALQVAKLSPCLGSLTGMDHDSKLSVKIGQNTWAFPLGLAAGLDKNAQALPFFSRQGFGSLECGTVTLRPQLGNPRPRLFRYKAEESLRNSMGFPNQGLDSILPRLKSYEGEVPLGVNIGKNKDTTATQSIEELCTLYRSLAAGADYFAVNVSSPNTPGLRALQEKSYLSELFSALSEVGLGKDLFLKIAPDLDKEKVLEISHLAVEHKLTGLIATNTTMMPERGTGGISGKLLREKSRLVQQTILNEDLPLELIAVGGLGTTEDLFDFWSQGGKVAQIYTAYIYHGPGLLKRIKSDIKGFLQYGQIPDLESFFKLSLAQRQNYVREWRAL